MLTLIPEQHSLNSFQSPAIACISFKVDPCLYYLEAEFGYSEGLVRNGPWRAYLQKSINPPKPYSDEEQMLLIP